MSAIGDLQTPLSWPNPVDTLFWPFTKDGIYSVKSGYRRLHETKTITRTQASSSMGIPNDCWKVIWGARVPEKHKHIMWKVYHNAIATRDNLFKRRIARDGICPICAKDQDTVEHFLLLCPWTRPVWFGSQICPTPNEYNVSSFPGWLLNIHDLWKTSGTDINIYTSQLF